MPKVSLVTAAHGAKPSANVSGHAALFWTLWLVESGACCAICKMTF